jgi:hypothetical protein
MIRRHDHTSSYDRPPLFQYRTVSVEGLMPPEQRAEYEGQAWECFNVSPPVGADDRKYDYHFKRPIVEPHRPRVRQVPGGRTGGSR